MATHDNQLKALRLLALVEGVSFIFILFVTMPLKYLAEMPMPNKVFGMAHGVLFIAYLAYLCFVWTSRRWSVSVLGWGLAASIVPFLIFWVEKKVFTDALAEKKA